MLDHVGLGVTDYQRSKAFDQKALAPLGITVLMEPMGKAAGFGTERSSGFASGDARCGRTAKARIASWLAAAFQ